MTSTVNDCLERVTNARRLLRLATTPLARALMTGQVIQSEEALGVAMAQASGARNY